ncbi:hypothetical protein [Paenibacillus riograndensis]|uniref:hypothetical protein n=1 Tax=Paenibacillus riograndensis TaxID=483937 RepID=UPI000B125F3F|nr:hypothetical protein [Paenibacillus riograndensis]
MDFSLALPEGTVYGPSGNSKWKKYLNGQKLAFYPEITMPDSYDIIMEASNFAKPN